MEKNIAVYHKGLEKLNKIIEAGLKTEIDGEFQEKLKEIHTIYECKKKEIEQSKERIRFTSELLEFKNQVLENAESYINSLKILSDEHKTNQASICKRVLAKLKDDSQEQKEKLVYVESQYERMQSFIKKPECICCKSKK